jgi:hypothetical protein
MMGLGSTCKLTPVYSSRVEVEFIGNDVEYVCGDAERHSRSLRNRGCPCEWGRCYGTTVGSVLTPTVITAATNQAFKNGGIITGLTPGTQYWFDIQLNAAAGTASLTGLTCNAKEVL